MFTLTSYCSASCLAHTCCSHCDEFLSEWITPGESIFHSFKQWTLAYLFRLRNAQFEVLPTEMTKEFLGMKDFPSKGFRLFGKCVCVSCSVYPTLLDPMDCSPSVHGILQARIPDRVAMPFSRGSSQPRDQTWVFCISGRFLIVWATREVPVIIFS